MHLIAHRAVSELIGIRFTKGRKWESTTTCYSLSACDLTWE